MRLIHFRACSIMGRYWQFHEISQFVYYQDTKMVELKGDMFFPHNKYCWPASGMYTETMLCLLDVLYMIKFKF